MRPSDEWQTQALCRGSHAHLFFPPTSFERKDERERREMRAVAICEVCPVVGDCRDHALSIREPFGIWGGLTEMDRRQVPATGVAS
ncbi:MAG: WhiB family transcriptional regulator [Acidimicrobiia bacterium]